MQKTLAVPFAKQETKETFCVLVLTRCNKLRHYKKSVTDSGILLHVLLHAQAALKETRLQKPCNIIIILCILIAYSLLYFSKSSSMMSETDKLKSENVADGRQLQTNLEQQTIFYSTV